MNRTSLRWWAALTLIGMAAVVGYAVGVLTTPTAEYVTHIDCPASQLIPRGTGR